MNLPSPKNNEFIKFISKAWFLGHGGYSEYMISKRTAEAKADNEAEKIKMAGEIERKLIQEKIDTIGLLEKADRFLEYENMYNVLMKTVPQITFDGERLDEIDLDKVKKIKDLSKEFSTDDMQELVSKILAGEYNNPGKYRMITINTIKNLSKQDIELFRKLQNIVIGKYIFISIFNGEHNDLVEKIGVSYEDVLYLQTLGLVNAGIGKLTASDGIRYTLRNGENEYIYTKDGDNKSSPPVFALSVPGFEILDLLDKVEIQNEFMEFVDGLLRKHGFQLEGEIGIKN